MSDGEGTADVTGSRVLPPLLPLVLLGLLVFVVGALAGPGRIDIVDGQTRYEVARSLVDHGDHRIRDPDVEFRVFPGRDGHLYTDYRFPQTALGVGAILVSDATGPVREGRRHFFFVLTSAASAAFVAMGMAWWFLLRGRDLRRALLWGALGVFATPCLFYATSTFDDIIGTAAVVGALVFAAAAARAKGPLLALASGLCAGLAFHAKPPLGIFVVPALAAVCFDGERLRLRWSLLLPLGLGLLAALGAWVGYDLYKFPPGTRVHHEAIRQWMVPDWTWRPLLPLLALAISPGVGALFYAPTTVLGALGMWHRRHDEAPLLVAVVLASAVFVIVVACLTYFSGDPAWGPRYLTPVFAVLWMWAPDALVAGWRRLGAALIGLGLVVQGLALTVDPHRLYIQLGLPTAVYMAGAQVYFFPQMSRLVQRPREIVEVATAPPAPRYTPSPSPTFAFPIFCTQPGNPLCDLRELGPETVARYHVLSGFRPWWASLRYLPPEERPVHLGATAAGLGALGVGALGGLFVVVRRRGRCP